MCGKNYINLTLNNIDEEDICCDTLNEEYKKGVSLKKEWLKNQIKKGHVFRKLNENNKVFIEYGPLEEEFVPIVGNNYMYICYFFVSNSFRRKCHSNDLIKYAIEDAKYKGKNGICAIVTSKKKMFLSYKRFLRKYGFKVVDKAAPYFELLALNFSAKEKPQFTNKVKRNQIDERGLIIYYSDACPYVHKVILDIQEICKEKNVELTLHYVNTVDKAKSMPYVMNNFCLVYNGKFITYKILNKNKIIKLLKI